MDLCVLWSSEEAPQDIWDAVVHHLAARSVIRDFENMAEKETDIEHGERKAERTKKEMRESEQMRESWAIMQKIF